MPNSNEEERNENYKENMLLVLSFLRAYGIAGRKTINSIDLSRAEEDKPSRDALYASLRSIYTIGDDIANKILAGQVPNGPIKIPRTTDKIAKALLPQDVQDANTLDQNSLSRSHHLLELTLSTYPRAYEEYQKWVAAPETYFDTQPIVEKKISMTNSQAIAIANFVTSDQRLRKDPAIRQFLEQIGLDSGKQR